MFNSIIICYWSIKTSINLCRFFENDEEKNRHVEKLINENFDLSPRGIREMLGLNRPIYEKTSAYGHFGRDARGKRFIFMGKN